MIHWTKIKLFQRMFLQKTTVILLIVALLLSSILIFFQVFQGALIQSLSQMNNEFVEQVDTISGTLLEIINNTAMQIFYSRSMKTLRTNHRLTNAERTAALRDLGQWVSSSTFLTSAIVYNSNMDVIFTSDGFHVENASSTYSDRSAAELLISRAKHGSSGPIKRQTDDGEAYSFLFFESSAPHGGSLLLNVRSDWYERQLLGVSSGQNSVILNELGELLVAGSEGLAQALPAVWPTLHGRITEDDGRRGGFILERNGKSGWMYYELSNLGLYYLRSFSTETIVPGITRIRNLALIMLMAVFALLLSGGLYSLFVLYMPIKAVQRLLQKAERSDEGMVKQVDRLLEGQLEQRALQQMECLLRGEEVIPIPYPATLILTDSPRYDLIKQVLTDLGSSIVLTAKTSIGHATLACGLTEQETLELCLCLSDAAPGRFFYGHPSNSAIELAQSHQNLVELWQLRFLHVGQQVFSERISMTYQSHLDFHTSNTEPLFNALRSGQLDEARLVWKGIFDKIRYGKYSDFRFFVRYILKNLLALQRDLGLEPLPYAPDLVDSLEDVGDLHQALDTMFIKITSAQDHKRKNSLQQLATRINERISAGYADDALSAQRIADEMGMNPVYLGRLYRECTGISIAEAIKRTRIEKAKQLLLNESNEPVKDIASKVGFSNTKYFFVVFKELVGMTPKEFQNIG